MSRLVRLLRARMRMLREDATAVAKVVEEAFKGRSELDDDNLDPQLRQVFYDLQDEKVLKVRRTEYEKDGRRLRGYFWSIDESAPSLARFRRDEGDPVEEVYDRLRDDAWERRRPPGPS